MTDCPASSLWPAFLEDCLPTFQEQELESHVTSCISCQRLLDEITQPANDPNATVDHVSHNHTDSVHVLPSLDEDFRFLLAEQLRHEPQLSPTLHPIPSTDRFSAPYPVVTGYEILE